MSDPIVEDTHTMKYILPLLAVFATLPAHADDAVATLLKNADRYRTGAQGEPALPGTLTPSGGRGSTVNLQVETQISTFHKDGSPDKDRRYTVFTQAQHKSLVLMRSPAEAGQKVLMLGDDFWLLLPGIQRPLRITPSQKLLGDASTGDIATLSWADDYAGTLGGEEKCDAVQANGAPQPCLRLSLKAQRKGLSYQRIELWIGKARHEPLRAELYVQSDKLAKLARFVVDKPGAPTSVTEMVLSDRLSNHKETRVRYLSRQAKQVPEAWLNPMFLARNPALD